MTRIAVLGAGLVGRTIARDLASDYSVTSFDRCRQTLDRAFPLSSSIGTRDADLSDASVVLRIAESFDLVVDALPGNLGLQTLQSVIEAGKPVVDIAFAPEDPVFLGDLALKKGVTAVVDMGVAPGMSNAILGYHAGSLAAVERFECMVGGLPRERRWPFEYRAPFSPSDVLEEYTRPARFREQGVDLVIPALSNRERVEFTRIGTLEAFDTDGLRSLLRSYPSIPTMREKTLRYPGHAALMEIFRESGFLSFSPVEINGTMIRPIDLTSRLLFAHWKLTERDEEFTVMRVVVEGRNQAGEPERHQWDLYDTTDFERQDSSMARTTGFACNSAVRLVLEGRLGPGLWFPEQVAEDGQRFESMLEYQRRRGVNYVRS